MCAAGARAQDPGPYTGQDLARWLSYDPVEDKPPLAEHAEKTEKADAEAKRNPQLTLLWDNDARLFDPIDASDDWYTNGTRIEYSFGLEPIGSGTDTFIKNVWLPWLPDTDRTNFSIAVTQEMYTPSDIVETDPINSERPYAGLLYLSGIFHRKNDVRLDTLEIKLGATGDWSGAESTQKFVHSALPYQSHPGGWDNQIDEQFAFEFDASRIWRTKAYNFGDSSWQWQLLPEAGVRLGNVQISANAALTARIGSNLPDDFGAPRIHGAWDPTGTWRDDFGWYLWGRAGAEAVAYDLLIDGNTDSTGLHPEHEPLVGVFALGAVLRYKGLHAGYTVNWETDRFEGQGRWDSFGTWVVGWRFSF